MAKIIETEGSKRRMIRMSTDDILSIVREYQTHVKHRSNYDDIRNQLDDCIFYIPEDI